MSVSAPFRLAVPSGSTIAPFPHPAHRTRHADFPPALGQDPRPLARATPSAVSEHFPELKGFPISMSFATSCVCLELRSLPSPGVTRFPRYYEPPTPPLRHPRAPGLSLTGLRLIVSLLTQPRFGAFRVARAFLVCMLPPLPRVQRLSVVFAHLTQPYQPRKGCRIGLHIVLFEDCLAFTRVAARTLALSPIVTRYTKGISHIVTSMMLRLLPAGAIWPGGTRTDWKAPPCHGAHPLRSFGQWARGCRPTVECGLTLDLDRHIRQGFFKAGQYRGGSFIWTYIGSGERVGSVGYETHMDRDCGHVRLHCTTAHAYKLHDCTGDDVATVWRPAMAVSTPRKRRLDQQAASAQWRLHLRLRAYRLRYRSKMDG